MSIKITLEGGKYVYECSDGYNQDVYRYGEHWRAFPGDNFIAAMANRIVELEKNQIPEGSHVIREEDLYGILAQNERLRCALNQCVHVVEDTNYGWDGDCGVINKVCCIVDGVLDEPQPAALAALKAQWRDDFVGEIVRGLVDSVVAGDAKTAEDCRDE